MVKTIAMGRQDHPIHVKSDVTKLINPKRNFPRSLAVLESRPWEWIGVRIHAHLIIARDHDHTPGLLQGPVWCSGVNGLNAY